MQIIKAMIQAMQDMRDGRRVIQQKRKVFEYDLMDQGVCLTREKPDVLTRGINRGLDLTRDIVKEFSA